MFCTNCGASNDDNAKFCAKCGMPLVPVTPPANQPVPESPAAPENQPVPEPAAAGPEPVYSVPEADPYDGGSMAGITGQVPPAKKSKAPVIAAVSVAVVLLVGGGTCFLFRDQLFGSSGKEESSSQAEEPDEAELEENLEDANSYAKYLYDAVATALVELDEYGYTAEYGYYLFTGAYKASEDSMALGDVSPEDCDVLLSIVDNYFSKLTKLDGFAFCINNMSAEGVIVEYEGCIGAYPNEMTLDDMEDMGIDEETLDYAMGGAPVFETQAPTEPETEPETELETEPATEKPESSCNLPDTDDTLSIVCWTDYDLDGMIDQFCADRGYTADVDVQYVNCGSSGGEASTMFATFLNSGEEDVDLFVAEADWIQQYINDYSYSAPLSDLGISEEEYGDAYDYTLQVGTNQNGELMAAAWQICPGGFCYNTDMAEEYLGITNPEDMQEYIGDWDGFESAAAILAENDITVCATLAGMWQAYRDTITTPWVNDGVINRSCVEEFTGMAKRYIDNGYVDMSVSQWALDGSWFEVGQNGETFGYFFSTWCLGPGAQLEQCCGAEGNWNIVEGPASYFWGGTWLCVSANCNSASMAADFIRYFTVDEDTMYDYALDYGVYVNNREVMSDLYYNNPLLGGQDEIEVLIDVAEHIDMSNMSLYSEALGDAYFYYVLSDNYDLSEDDIIDAYLEEAVSLFPALSAE